MFFNLLAIDLQQAFANIETWVSAAIVFLLSSGVGGVIIGLLARRLTKKVNTQTTVSKEQIEKVANTASEQAVKKMIGKSFNVNIKSEVDKTVKAEMKPIRENAEYAAAASRNAEIAAAHVLLAQSRSRLLNETEQANLQSIANKILAHASDTVIAPMIIEIEEAPKSISTKKEKTEPTAVAENISLISFADVE